MINLSNTPLEAKLNKAYPEVLNPEFYQVVNEPIFAGRIIENDVISMVSGLAKTSQHLFGSIPQITFGKGSYCQVSGRDIKICIDRGILSLDLDKSDIVDLVFGMYLHEAGHAMYTFTEESASKYYRSSIKKTLMNVVEDRRIECKLSHEYPGYRSYLIKLRAHMTGQGDLKTLLKNIAEQPRYGDYNNPLTTVIVANLLFPDTFEAVLEVAENVDISIFQKALAGVLGVLNVERTYREMSYYDVEDMVDELIRFYSEEERGYKEKPEFMKSIEQGKGGKSFTSGGKQIKQIIESTFNESKDLSLEDVMTNIANKYPKDKKSIETAESKVPQINDICKMNIVAKNPSKQELCEVKEIASALKRNFYTATASKNKTRQMLGLEEGELDVEVLAESRFTRDLFFEEEPAKALSLDLILLMDASGSMNYDSISKQFIAAAGIASAFSKMKGCSVKVIAHSANIQGPNSLDVNEVFSGKGQLDLNLLRGVRARNENADGFAIEYAASKFKRSKGKKILIAISDGLPSACGYRGTRAVEHTAEVVKSVEAKGISVLSVPVGDRFSKEDQRQMFSNYIPYSHSETVGVLLRDYFIKEFRKSSRR